MILLIVYSINLSKYTEYETGYTFLCSLFYIYIKDFYTLIMSNKVPLGK